MGRIVTQVSKRALRRLVGYGWPGNIDELASVLECAIAASVDPVLEIDTALLDKGNRVGSYELVERLGVGGMGEVWLAKHQLLVRPAAIKLIRSETMSANRDATLKRFEREAKATAALESPNTVRLYDYGITKEGDLYYVMERLRGMDLDRLVETHGPLPVDRSVAALIQACSSLAEAHAAGMVHRDIKPANLFLSVMGKQCDVLKVLDFGTVRRAQSEKSDLTGQMVLGTPAFMAPEQIMGHSLDGRADIYALGCTAFWLLTGKLVFDAPHVPGIIAKHITQPPPQLADVAPCAIPDVLESVVINCLAKEPKDRPADALELRDALIGSGLATTWTESSAHDWWRENSELVKD